MKLPRRVDYACRVLTRLAQNQPGLARVEELARDENISANYLVQILNELRTAGLVDSRRGRAGGYRLARPLHEITLARVVGATEGILLEIPDENESSPPMRAMWGQVVGALEAVMEEITLDQWTTPAESGDWMI